MGRLGVVSRVGVTEMLSADAAELGLLRRLEQRDLEAFEALYRSYHSRLTRFLLNMTRRPSLVEEVINDTMMVVWTQPDRFNGMSKLSTWIFAIAYRKALKALRRHDLSQQDLEADNRASPEAGPEQQVGQRQISELILRSMDELSADHRAVVDLTYFHELGYLEIAEIMNCPEDTVKSRMYYARRHLARIMPGPLADWL